MSSLMISFLYITLNAMRCTQAALFIITYTFYLIKNKNISPDSVFGLG